MRLRLRIERNELPPVQVLHAIPPTQQSQTISQFLQSINALFPLESTTWDISDYTVLVGGYEATHYTEVGQAFKDEDEVVIKPLGFAELRARTLSGRDQISEDGRHLLDGVPFGRPMLKRPRRPDVVIPARKRQKADEVTDAQALVRLDGDDEEDDEEDDEDFEEAEVEEDSEGDDDENDENDADDSSDSSDSDSSAEDSSSDGSGSSSDDSSDSDSSSSSSESESEASWDGLEGKASTVKAAPKPNGTAAPQPEQQQNLPHQGKSRTKERNDRKRDSRRLKHLKEAGLLPQNATLQDMQKWQKEKGLDDESVTLAGQKAKMESGRQRLLEQIASGGVDIASPVPASREDDEPPEEQSSRPVATATGIMDEATSSDAASTQIITEAQQAAEATPLKAKTKREADTDADQSPASKRARLDTRSMNRLVFGSLGLRTPKTQEERDALQKKLSTHPTRAGAATAPAEAVTEPTPQADEAPDSWREKVVLTAVECVDENITLSEPPFPFQQRWDPQYQFSVKQRKRSRARKSHAQTNGEFIETYDKYNQNGGGDALDYDDPKDDQEGDDSYWEEGALLDNGDEVEDSDDEFPPLPADHASLPSLVEADAKVGDFVTYQELAVSAATGWEPKVVAQIAKLEAKTDDGFWTLMLRQSRPKEYDENGNRIYTKFEMEDFSDDGNETDSKTLSWVELQNPKLLLRSVDTKAS